MMIPKFRVWCKNNKEWERDTCYIQQDGLLYQRANNSERLIPILPQNHIVMQSTGLKDKNGVEIFEGDILKRKVHVALYGTDLDEWVEENYPVEWKYGGWHVGEDLMEFVLKAGVDRHTGCYQTATEVIGNIYANPELLKK